MKALLHYFLWFLVFFNGIFRLLETNVALVRVGPPLLILVLLFFTLQQKNLQLPHLKTVMALFFVIIVSSTLNSIRPFQTVDFITYLLFPYLYFIIIVNERNHKLLRGVLKLIIVLFFLQIPAGIVKYITMGQVESYIGTVSVSEGSLSTIIPMFATAFLFSRYLFRKNIMDIFFIVCFVLFGIVGEKRAIVFFIPALMIILYLVFAMKNKVGINLFLRKFIKIGIIGCILLYIMVILNPTLTSEGQIMGSFDLNYVLNYTQDYNVSKDIHSGEMSRPYALWYFINYLPQQGVLVFLFGEGAGKLLITEENPMQLYYGVRYGGRMGIVWIYLQIGIIGLSIYLFFLYRVLSKIWHSLSSNPNYYSLATFGLFVSIMFDVLIYSVASLLYFPISGVFLFFHGIVHYQHFLTPTKQNIYKN